MARTPGRLERISAAFTRWSGTSLAFMIAVTAITLWLVAGPFYHFSDSWQLLMNTVTSIVTFLMVFLIQRTQNKESSAIQLKLNELIAAVEGASNRLINVEDRSEQDVMRLHALYKEILRQSLEHPEQTRACSIEGTVRAARANGHAASRPQPRTRAEIRRSIRRHLQRIAHHEIEIGALRTALRAQIAPGPEAMPMSAMPDEGGP